MQGISSNIKIVIVDDHQLLRNCLSTAFNDYPEIDVIGEAENGRDLLEKLKYLQPKLILLDLEMPVMNGKETMEQLRINYPKLHVIVITNHAKDFFLNAYIKLGAKAFVPKNIALQKLVAVIKKVINGEDCVEYSKDIVKIEEKKNVNNEPLFIGLSKREKEVLQMICLGKSTKNISELMFVDKRAIEYHKTNLFKKFNVKNSAELLAMVVKSNAAGLV